MPTTAVQPPQLNRTPRYSAVQNPPAADPTLAHQHFAARLAFETDVADLMADLQKGNPDLVVIDTRSAKSYAECHIPGAINVSKIDEETTADFTKNKLYVTYCWGIACNGSTRAAMKLAALGFRAKEMIGGIEYWRKEGGEVEGTLGENAPMYWRKGD